MKLLTYDDFSVLLTWSEEDNSWIVGKVFRPIKGRTEAEIVSVGHLPWSVRISIAEYCNQPIP
jgi:hypothetical protein